MKTLAVLTLLVIAFAWDMPARAALDCTYFSRGFFTCIESQDLPGYIYSWDSEIATVTPLPNNHRYANAECYNAFEPYQTHHGRPVQDIRDGLVRVIMWFSSIDLGITHTDGIICEGVNPEPQMYAYVRGWTFYWDLYDSSHRWDFWCTYPDYVAGHCWHSQVYNSFNSWYIEHY